MQKGLKYILFIFLILVLWVPLLQEEFKWFKELTLKGAFIKPYKPNLSVDSLKTLEYQNQYEKYENANFGFRPFLIKFKNSVNYVLFKELSISDNIAGKDNFIFSRGSTQRTLGISYNGKEKNEATVDKIKFFQEGIEKTGGHFLVVIPPSKESVLPELLPFQYNRATKESTDYKDFIAGYRSKGIHVLDYIPCFTEWKKTVPYPLFTKTGFHWSVYAASLAHDTLIAYMQSNLPYPMINYNRVGVELSDTAREPDADFEGPLNLLFNLGQPPYYYPKFNVSVAKKDSYKPKVIIIGDSFFWQLKNQKLMQKIFTEDSKFWYYFATNSFPIGDVPGVPLKDINVMNELRTADYVLLVGNISTMDAFPYGIADYYYNNISTGEIYQAIYEQVRSIPALNGGTKDEGSINETAKRICRDAKRTGLMAANGKFICAGGADELILSASRDVVSDWERFTIYELDNNRVAISSYKNNFLSAELGKRGEITSTRDKIGGWEKFEVIKLKDGQVAFKADNGKYLSLTASGQIFAIANSVGVKERFMYEVATKK
ncbi:MAG: alginate O-acetyltransferase AlgX-related protein [Bacteroidia bacterium]